MSSSVNSTGVVVEHKVQFGDREVRLIYDTVNPPPTLYLSVYQGDRLEGKKSCEASRDTYLGFFDWLRNQLVQKHLSEEEVKALTNLDLPALQACGKE